MTNAQLIRFKLFDLIGQIIVLILTIALYPFYNTGIILFNVYFVIGGWQVLSFLINMFVLPKVYKASTRKMYAHILLLITVLALTDVVAMFFSEHPNDLGIKAVADIGEGLAIFLAYGLLILFPFIAGFYWAINLSEYKKLKTVSHE